MARERVAKEHCSMQPSPNNAANGPSRTDKVCSSPAAALEGISQGATVFVAGFAGGGWPRTLLEALHSAGVDLLTIVCQGLAPDLNGDGHGPKALEELVAAGRVAKLVSPLPFIPGGGGAVEAQWRAGDLELEVIPQGTLAERIRAAGAGLGGVYLPAGPGTRFAEGKEVKSIGGREHVLEPPLRADFALLQGHAADTLGNTVYQSTQRNWNPVMAMAAQTTVIEVDEIVEPGALDPETVITPGIFVDRIVKAGDTS